jgi:hypothetical protein
MVHKPSEYWANFGRFKDKTDEARTRKGPSSTEQMGAKYDFHDGDAVGEQKGNKSTIQTGWSNSYLRGFSFSTTLGQSTSTTVGNSFTNHTGFKWGMFVGPETSINAAASVKVTKGGAYSFDTVAKWTTKAQDVKTAVKETQIATDLKRTIGQEISALTGYTQVVSGTSSASSGSFRVFSIKDIDLYSGTSMKLKSTLVNIGSNTWLNLNATARVTMTSDGPATINGLIIRIG